MDGYVLLFALAWPFCAEGARRRLATGRRWAVLPEKRKQQVVRPLICETAPGHLRARCEVEVGAAIPSPTAGGEGRGGLLMAKRKRRGGGVRARGVFVTAAPQNEKKSVRWGGLVGWWWPVGAKPEDQGKQEAGSKIHRIQDE